MIIFPVETDRIELSLHQQLQRNPSLGYYIERKPMEKPGWLNPMQLKRSLR